MAKYFLIIITILFTIDIVSAQSENQEDVFRKSVLHKAIIKKTFTLGKWTKEGETELQLSFLGQVKTKSREIFKVVNSIYLFGLSCKATPRILIFDRYNQYLGNYYVGIIDDLPRLLKNGKLIFRNSSADCDTSLVTIVDFTDGLPKEFFKKCKGNSGDFYSFAKE